MEVGKTLLSLRSRRFLNVWDVVDDVTERIDVNDTISAVHWSPNGKLLAVSGAGEEGLTLHLASNISAAPVRLPGEAGKTLRWFGFSPLGTYLSTYWSTTSPETPNFYVWKIQISDDNTKILGATLVSSERQVNQTQETIAYVLQWRDDEKFRVCHHGHQLSVSLGHDFESRPLAVIPIEAKFTATLAPASKHAPERVGLHLFAPALPHQSDSSGEIRFVVLSSENESAPLYTAQVAVREIQGVDSCEILWAPSGRRYLIQTSCLVDSAGKSYGSISDLWLCDLDSPSGDYELAIERLDAIKENMGVLENGSVGPLKLKKVNHAAVQDAKWSPVADEFILIEGRSPTTIHLFDGKSGEKIQHILKGYRNTIRWSPHGDMVAIGGFGNMAGDLSFYYREEGALKLIADWREACVVVCDWSPCGRYFYTAATRPRLNVDNVVKLWDREGSKVKEVPYEELFDVEWRRVPGTGYPRLPAPKASVSATKSNQYRPRNWQSADPETQLVAKYMEGQISELPEDVQRKLKTGRPQRYEKLARSNEPQHDCDLAMDWRSGQSSEPPSEVVAAADSQPPPSHTVTLPDPKRRVPKRSTPETATLNICPPPQALQQQAPPFQQQPQTVPFQQQPQTAPFQPQAAAFPQQQQAAPFQQQATPFQQQPAPPFQQQPAPPFQQAAPFQQPGFPPALFPKAPFQQAVPPPYQQQGSSTRRPPPPPASLSTEPVPVGPSSTAAPSLDLLSLLQSILPHARVQVQPGSAPLDEQDHLRRLLKGAGLPIDEASSPPVEESTKIWEYVDPHGNIQGPFSRKEMREWWNRGYFSGNLPVRWESKGRFRPLKEIYPDKSRVFSS